MMSTVISIFISLFILVASMEPASAQSGKEAEGQSAERAGRLREALTHYVAALQSVSEGSADDLRLRETIIKLVQKLSPPPAVPEEARRFSIRGQTWIKEAKNPLDFEEAAKEFARAVRVAPWWADGYINQGVALEKAGKFSEAIRSLKLYLLAASAAPDADKVKEQIYALEVRQEKAQRDAVAAREEQERKRQEEATSPQRLAAATWCVQQVKLDGEVLGGLCAPTISLQVSGSRVWTEWHWDNGGGFKMNGVLSGTSLRGDATIFVGTRPQESYPAIFEGELSDDGATITIRPRFSNPALVRPFIRELIGQQFFRLKRIR